MNQGLFLVIDGTDKTETAAQTMLLVERLSSHGHTVVTIDTPNSSDESGYFIRQYEQGSYGTAESVGPYTGSIFYSMDRYDIGQTIRQAINEGCIVLSNNFTATTMANQSMAFSKPVERNGYYVWLDTIEFQMLGIPRPDLTIVLRMPSIDTELEARSYDELCNLFPRDFKSLDCIRGNKVLSREVIHTLIRETVDPLLPPTASTSITSTKAEYYIPANLDSDTTETYRAIIDQIAVIADDIRNKLSDYIQMHSDVSVAERDDNWNQAMYEAIEEVIMPLRPVATLSDASLLPFEQRATQSFAPADSLSDHYSNDMNAATVTSVTPRNELDIVPTILYPHSGASLQQIQDDVNSWSYDTKASTLEQYLDNAPRMALTAVQYSLDMMTSYATLLATGQISHSLQWQPLTPRFGYDVPALIQDADVSDEYDACFDLSLKLYSILQSNGHDYEAQFATLYGHKVRWAACYNGLQIPSLLQAIKSDRTSAGALFSALADRHPQLAEHYKTELRR